MPLPLPLHKSTIIPLPLPLRKSTNTAQITSILCQYSNFNWSKCIQSTTPQAYSLMLSSRTHARKQGGYSQPVWPARVRPAYGEGQGISCPAWVLPGLTAPSYTLKEKPKPPINHFGLCGQKRVWGSYPNQDKLIAANECVHVTASSASFPYTFGPLARGLKPNQGGIRTAGQKSIGSWARFTLRSFARDCK